MQVNLVRVLSETAGVSEDHICTLAGQGVIRLDGKPIDPRFGPTEIMPGQKVHIAGLTVVYFAAATEEDIAILTGRKRTVTDGVVKTVETEKVAIPADLTLSNFKDRMGRRFRMTKEQAARNLSREQAFQEWKSGHFSGN